MNSSLFPSLQIVKTWIVHDSEPLLFVAVDNKKQHYLFNAISEEGSSIIHLAVLISEIQCETLCSKNTGFRDIFGNQENIVLKIIHDYDTQTITTITCDPSKLLDVELPEY